MGVYQRKKGVSAVVLEDLWVLPDYIGKDIGRKLFEHAIEQAQLSGADHLELDADPNAAPFYIRMGCHPAGERISEWGRAVPYMVCDRNCSGMRLKPRLRGRFAPGDRLCGRRGSVHAGGRPAKSLPEAISIAERQSA